MKRVGPSKWVGDWESQEDDDDENIDDRKEIKDRWKSKRRKL